MCDESWGATFTAVLLRVSESAHPQRSDHLDRQSREPQRLHHLLEGADLCSALCPQSLGQYPQIQHQMATGPHRGRQGMDDHQQRKQGQDRDRATASTMGAVRQGCPRVDTTVKINTRTDQVQALPNKLSSVKALL